MPQAFDMCVSKGGRVRTKELGKGKYMHVCFMNGKSYAGEVKMKQTMKPGSNKYTEAMQHGK